MILNQNALKLGTNNGWEYIDYQLEKKLFSKFFLKGSGWEKIGEKLKFFAIFCIFFTKKSIKQTPQ